ncbi:MAG: hypothetical protein AAF581_10930 [Planctomycetota bacterium]
MKLPIRASLALVAVLATGCAHFEASPLAPHWTASSQIGQQEISGLSIAARTLDGMREENEYIGRPARDRGFLPLVLLFENTGDRAFLIRREGIKLETADGKTYPAAELSEIYDGLRFSKGAALWGVPLGLFPAFFMGSRISEQNEKLLEDLNAKTFHDLRLFRNPRSYNSLAFFDLNERLFELGPGDFWLSVEVEKDATPEAPGEILLFRLTTE